MPGSFAATLRSAQRNPTSWDRSNGNVWEADGCCGGILKPQFSPQITQINADYYVVMNEHRVIQKVSKHTKATRCLICGNLCNLRANKFFWVK